VVQRRRRARLITAPPANRQRLLIQTLCVDVITAPRGRSRLPLECCDANVVLVRHDET
jgi:hypothetical protein